MFTNNMVNFMKMVAIGGTFSFTNPGGATFSSQLSYISDGFIQYMDTAKCREIVTGEASSVYPGVYFGTGSTPANKADYTLESPIASGLSISSGNRLYVNEGNGVHSYHVTYAVKNTTEAEINIYEIGLFAEINTNDYAANTKKQCAAMMERTVLTEPITIAPGETKLVTYKVTFNQTTK